MDSFDMDDESFDDDYGYEYNYSENSENNENCENSEKDMYVDIQNVLLKFKLNLNIPTINYKNFKQEFNKYYESIKEIINDHTNLSQTNLIPIINGIINDIQCGILNMK